MTVELFVLLQACCEGKKPSEYVFTRLRWSKAERNRKMRPVGDFRKLWRAIVKKAGIERDVLIHDFRRSAVSNMIERGVDRDVAKMISGHKTDSMLTRYNIGRESKVIAALTKIEAGKQQERALAKQATVSQPAQASGPPVGHSEFDTAVLDSLEVTVN